MVYCEFSDSITTTRESKQNNPKTPQGILLLLKGGRKDVKGSKELSSSLPKGKLNHPLVCKFSNYQQPNKDFMRSSPSSELSPSPLTKLPHNRQFSKNWFTQFLYSLPSGLIIRFVGQVNRLKRVQNRTIEWLHLSLPFYDWK